MRKGKVGGQSHAFKFCQLESFRSIPVSRRISRRPRKNFGLAAVDFAKPLAAGEKKNSAKPPVQRRLILPTLTISDKCNVSPVEKTKYCCKSDSRHDSDGIRWYISC